jgi:hypothetical protein
MQLWVLGHWPNAGEICGRLNKKIKTQGCIKDCILVYMKLIGFIYFKLRYTICDRSWTYHKVKQFWRRDTWWLPYTAETCHEREKESKRSCIVNINIVFEYENINATGYLNTIFYNWKSCVHFLFCTFFQYHHHPFNCWLNSYSGSIINKVKN